jgi:hypothetical protein
MVDSGAEFRRCLLELDVEGIKRAWRHVAPNMPPPKDDAEALASLHVGRTAANSMPFSKRAYSHAWLSERGLPSMLPDNLRPKAQRMYPVVGLGVGISVRALSEHNKPAARIIQGAMENAVLEADADGRLADDKHVKARIDEARRKAINDLYG